MATDKAVSDSTIRWISPKKIKIIQDRNPRKQHNPGFSAEKMNELMRDIQNEGLRYALIVWEDKPDEFRLLGGERRYRNILRLIDLNEMCLCPRGTGRRLPASEAYATIQCRVVQVASEREARRIARKDNTLHESLTDYEILLQVQEMEKDGYSREEQSIDFDMSEAWISQSHTLLALCKTYRKIEDAMSRGVLGRTQALHFLPIWEATPEKVEEVYDKAFETHFVACREKLNEAIEEQRLSLDELDITEAKIRAAEIEDRKDDVRELKRKARASNNKYRKATNKVNSAKGELNNPHLTGDGITTASRKTEGADVLNKPITIRNVRIKVTEIMAAIEKNGDEEVIEFNGQFYERSRVNDFLKGLKWVVGEIKSDNPLDLLRE